MGEVQLLVGRRSCLNVSTGAPVTPRVADNLRFYKILGVKSLRLAFFPSSAAAYGTLPVSGSVCSTFFFTLFPPSRGR